MPKKREFASALTRAILRSKGIYSIHPEIQKRFEDDPQPYDVYNTFPAVTIDCGSQPTTETRRQADEFFNVRLKQAAAFKPSKVDTKQAFFQKLLHAGKLASHVGGTIRYSRNHNNPDATKANLQVIDIAIEQGLFREVRSPKGSPMESRLLPRSPIKEITDDDPWAFDPNDSKRFVFLVDRKTHADLPFNIDDHAPAYVQRRLERVNAVNAGYEITYSPFSDLEDDFGFARQLRPIHYARFTDDFSQHGRLYTGRYGHQALRRFERRTIHFNAEPSIELDYSGMHCRMLYHLEGIGFDSDPYALWGDATTPQLRLLAKTLVNALINAKSQRAAVSACNQKMMVATAKREWKSGKALIDARNLKRAQDETGLSFKDVCELALSHHAPIRHRFGNDWGMKLMWIDSAIALDILNHFALQDLPCLSVHDSFIVPLHCQSQLFAAMNHYYAQRLGQLPTVPN